MFLDNKYTRWYYLLMDKRRKSPAVSTGKYTVNRHHIIPLCLGGLKEGEQVSLTIREHLLAHRLLPHMTDNWKHQRLLLYAHMRMLAGHQGVMVKMTDRQRQICAERLSVLQRRRMTGRVVTEITRQRLSAANRGKVMSNETKEKLRQKAMGRYKGIRRSPEFCRAVSEGLKGHKKTPEWIDKINRNPEKIAKTAAKHRGMTRTLEQRARMGRKKGCPAWNKGITMTPTQRAKMGRKKGSIPWNKGKNQTMPPDVPSSPTEDSKPLTVSVAPETDQP